MTDNTNAPASPEKESKKGAAHILTRPVVAVGAVVIGALSGAAGGAIEDVVRPEATRVIHEYIERDDPVLVKAEVSTFGGDMWLPSTVDLTEEDLAKVSATDKTGQPVWWENKGAVELGPKEARVLLTGNRAGGVRITDLRPVSECSSFGTGLLVKMVPAIGGIPTTHRMIVNVEDPSEPPKEYVPPGPTDPGGSDQNFFDVKNITLEKGEQEFVLVRMEAETNICTVDLELTLVEGQEESTQRVFGEGHEVKVASFNSTIHTAGVQRLLAGGEMCWEYVELELSQLQGAWDREVCGPNNAGPFWGRLDYEQAQRAATAPPSAPVETVPPEAAPTPFSTAIPGVSP